MKQRIFALSAALGLLAFCAAGCGSSGTGGGAPAPSEDTPQARAAARMLNVGIAQDLDSSLDPHKTVKAGTREVMFNVFEGLMKPTPEGELAPALAEGYTVSDDGLLYTFRLRRGAKFHSGEPVTPRDVVWSYQRCAQAQEPGIVPVEALAAAEIYAQGEESVCFRLQEGSAEFLSYLTTAVLPADYTGQDTAPVGTGPFRFVSRRAQESIILSRFDDYWGEAPQLAKVTYKIIENADSILLSLQSGAVDLFAHLTPTQTAQLGTGFHVEMGLMNLVQALYLNHARPPFDDLRVRQALCHAIDRQQILDLAFDGYGALVGSSMYPAFGKYFDESLTDYYAYDPDRARALLKEAGYEDGFDMEITVPSNYQPHMDTAQVIVQQLRAVGIRAVIRPVPFESWISDAYKDRQFHSTVVGVDASSMTARAMLERFVSTAGGNFINYSSPAYDDLFAQAQSCDDDARQTALYQQMQRNLTENAANVYIQDLADLVAVRDGIEGPTFYPVYVLDLSSIRYST